MNSSRVNYLPADTADFLVRRGRPLVTVSFAQSLDGSLTLRQGEPSPVSGDESMRITHELRSAHDAIIVGIGTVLADDPRLTVRLVDGQDSQPIVLDSQLRFPKTSKLSSHPCGVWIATTHTDAKPRWKSLEDAGVRLLTLDADQDGRVDLTALLDHLGKVGIRSVMVEGGGEVITSFLRLGLADRAVVTIAPVFAAGYRAVQRLDADHWGQLPRLSNMRVLQAGEDLIVWGDLR
jgi:riboflavin-specific deaminase-like protein